MNDKKRDKEDRFNVDVLVEHDCISIIEVKDDKSITRINIPNKQVRSIVNLVACLIDEDIPAIIEKNKLEDSTFRITMALSLKCHEMLIKE